LYYDVPAKATQKGTVKSYAQIPLALPVSYYTITLPVNFFRERLLLDSSKLIS
jgi:hypothetical protein